MKGCNGEKMELCGEGWKDLREIAILGFGKQGQRNYKTLKKYFEVVAIIDNDASKQGVHVDHLTIESLDTYLARKVNAKIIVSVQETYYVQVRKQLEDRGKKEGIDFVESQRFVSEWYSHYSEKTVIMKMDIPITHFCTLRCKNCIDLIPYFKVKERKELSDVIADLDVFFSVVDYVIDVSLIGGEPLLFSEIDELLDYIAANYRDRIGYLGITTNGTIIPKMTTIERFKKYDVGVSISDYSDVVGNRDKIDQICQLLEERNIYYLRNEKIEWFDFGILSSKYYFEDAYGHMQSCNSTCHILDKKRIYYCSVDYSAQNGGLMPEDNNSYIELENYSNLEEKKKEVVSFLAGNLKQAPRICARCGGFGVNNNVRVVAGEQVE